MKRDRQYILMLIMTFVRYLGDAFFYGYFYLFLKSRGLAEDTIGIVTALTPLVSILLSPIWNHFAKDFNASRKIMTIITIFEGIFIISISRCFSLEFIILFTVLIAVVGTPFYNFHNGFCDTYAKLNNKAFSVIRAMGSIAYVCALLFISFILKWTDNNYELLFYIGGGLFIVTSVFLFLIKPITVDEIKQVGQRDYKKVLTNKKFIIYVVIINLTYLISFTADNFISLFLTTDYSITPAGWAYIYAGFVTVETICYFAIAKLKINPSLGIIIMAFLYMSRWFLYSLGISKPLVIAATMLRGIAFGLSTPMTLKKIEKIVGIENVTTGCFISGIFASLFQILSSVLFGKLITLYGYKTFFLIIAIIVFVGLIIAIIDYIFELKQEKKEKTVLE